MEEEKDILLKNDFVIEKAKTILDDLYSRNTEFNEFLDQANTYTFTSSEVLFYTDLKTYLDELKNWKENKSDEEYCDMISFIGREGESTLQELIQGIRRKRVAPFVGAGISATLEFPSWGQALREIRAKFDDVDLHDVEDLILENKYLEAAELLYAQENRIFTSYVSDRFVINPNFTKNDVLVGALKYLPELSHGCVITTNFDKTLEKIFEESGKSFRGFMHGIQPRTTFVKDLIKGERCILKLHGSVGEEDSYIFTLSQYNSAYGDPLLFENPLPKTLRQIYISHSLLFLGCSLEKDKTLELFQQIKQEGQFEIPQHFAILPAPATSALKRAKESYLRDINIKTIWYPYGEHEYVETILKYIVESANRNNL
jgi:hypothetical protein